MARGWGASASPGPGSFVTPGQGTPEFVTWLVSQQPPKVLPACLSLLFHLPAEDGGPAMASRHSDNIQVQKKRIWLVEWEGSGRPGTQSPGPRVKSSFCLLETWETWAARPMRTRTGPKCAGMELPLESPSRSPRPPFP